VVPPVSLSDVPARVFLDTCVVNLILDYGPQIYEREAHSEGVSERIVLDCDALSGILMICQRATWELAISLYTYGEVLATTDVGRRKHLESWFFDLWGYWRSIVETDNSLPTFLQAEQERVELLASGKLDCLPDLQDRLLICDAIIYRCDAFCTRDWSSILKFRHKLVSLPITVISPAEWWSKVEPYAGLWA
jgi:hypothetical protein